MALNEREKNLAYAVGAVALALVAYYALDAFYLSPARDLSNSIDKARRTIAENKSLLAGDEGVRLNWIRLNLPTSSADAAKVIGRIYDLAGQARFNITNWAGGAGSRSNVKSDIDEVRFTANGQGNSRQLAAFMLLLEREHAAEGLPIRVDEISISSRKDGLDDLTATITITALVYNPKATTKPGTATPGRAPTTGRGSTTGRGPATGRGTTSTAPSTTTSQPSAEDLALKAAIEKQMMERRALEMAPSQSATEPATQGVAPPTSQPAPKTQPATQPIGGAQ